MLKVLNALFRTISKDFNTFGFNIVKVMFVTKRCCNIYIISTVWVIVSKNKEVLKDMYESFHKYHACESLNLRLSELRHPDFARLLNISNQWRPILGREKAGNQILPGL